MDTTLPSSSSAAPLGLGLAWEQLRRMGPPGLIILLHVLFFYALQSGLLRQAAQALPKEVFVSFITPEAAPASKPQVPPKTVPVVKKAASPPSAIIPSVNTTPSPQLDEAARRVQAPYRGW